MTHMPEFFPAPFTRSRWSAVAAAALGLGICAPAGAQLTYSLAGGNSSWPADKRAAIIAAMDAAVQIYNDNGYFPRSLTANYNASVPTAQASYSGWIDFGGMIGTRVAMHEISHTLGAGTYSTWDDHRSGGQWTGVYAKARVKLFDGASAILECDGVHFWPYGLNYDTEDGTLNRERHVKMVSALRRDMGIVADSDGDGMPDDWEMFQFGQLGRTGGADLDGDGVTNLGEYQADTNPDEAFVFDWTGVTSSNWATTTNWAAPPRPPPVGTTHKHRLNVNQDAGFPLIYSATQGVTTYANPTGRGLVIGSGSSGANTSGTMTITGGTFSTRGSISADVVGNGTGNTGALVVDGGAYSSELLHLGNIGGGAGTFWMKSGTASIDSVVFNFGTGGAGTMLLSGGILTTSALTRTGGTGTLLFDGGTLKAGSTAAILAQGLSNAYIQDGGAVIDTAGREISLPQLLRVDTASPGGGLTKRGAGSLTPTGVNTYTGVTTVEAGTLYVTRATGVLGATAQGTVVEAGATLALSGGIAYAAGEALQIAGAGEGSRGALQSDAGGNTWNGPVVVAAAGCRIGAQDGAALTVAGAITEATPGLGVIFRSGLTPGFDVTVSGAANVWTGPTVVFSSSSTGGAVKLGRDNAFPAGAELWVAGNAVDGRLDLNGFDLEVRGLAHSTGGSSPIGNGRIINGAAAPSTLTLNPAATETFNGVIANGVGVIHLVKTGSATQTLGGLNAYGGETRVTGGTLSLVQPGLADTAAVRIQSPGRLQLGFAGTDTVAELEIDGVYMPPGDHNAALRPGRIAGTGALRVPDRFAAWTAAQFPGQTNPLVIGAAADANGDGESNLMEFATGQGAMSAGLRPCVLVAAGATFDFTYTRSLAALRNGIQFRPEWSADPGAVVWNDASAHAAVIATAGDLETVRVSIPLAGLRMVARLRVVKP